VSPEELAEIEQRAKVVCGLEDPHSPIDVTFFTQAREDVPALLAEVKRLQGRDRINTAGLSLAHRRQAEHKADRDRARDAAVALEQENARVRELHHSPKGALCVECCEEWPCPTIQIFDGGEGQ
jgi:hypothetical protein